MLLPKTWSVWEHTNGNKYRVMLVTNNNDYKSDKYPATVVYENIVNGTHWPRPLSDWYRSMTLVR